MEGSKEGSKQERMQGARGKQESKEARQKGSKSDRPLSKAITSTSCPLHDSTVLTDAHVSICQTADIRSIKRHSHDLLVLTFLLIILYC